jgi:hypothetical protein
MTISLSKIDGQQLHWHFSRACRDHQQGDRDMTLIGNSGIFSVEEFIVRHDTTL